MLIITAKFFIQAEQRTAFLADINALIASSRQDEGCLAYDFYESLETNNHFVMVENWASEAAVQTHNQNPLLLALLGKVVDYSSKAPIIQVARAEGEQ